MRVVVAPDKWAGTLSAGEAATAIRDGWLAAAPADECETVPLSDGGPGFVDVLATVLPGQLLTVTVPDPLGRPVPAPLLLVGGTAYVESAAAAGLHLLAPAERDPERARSDGVGVLVRAALDAGATTLVVGLGGSGTSDGGAGMLAALGARGADLSALDPRLAATRIVAATDVDNPLLGLSGAAAVFGPQKFDPQKFDSQTFDPQQGAGRAAVLRLDAALTAWADALEAAAGVRVRDLPGAGAAGGIGAALYALGAVRRSGVDVVLEAVGLRDRLAGADLVITGEGSYDATSLRGKTVAGVAAVAQDAGLPCLVLAGTVAVGRREAAAHGVEAAYATAESAGSAQEARARPAYWLRALAGQVAAQWGTPA